MAIAKDAHAQMLATGMAGYFDESFDKFAEAAGGTERDGRHARQRMIDQDLLYEHQPRFYRETPALILFHEQFERAERYRQNAVRRFLLEEMRDVDDQGDWAQFREAEDDEHPGAQMLAAARVLEHLGLVEVRGELPAIFNVKLTSAGRDALADERVMRASLPLTPTEDEEAHAVVARDAMHELITSCEQMLEHHAWETALDELRKADNEYADGDWVNAVRDYYSALESGLKYVLHHERVEYGETKALARLVTRAAQEGLIPANYQALFGFTDSIRSPRSHGAGPKGTVVPVEIGPAEALLIGNHVRALLLYLGQRPQL